MSEEELAEQLRAQKLDLEKQFALERKALEDKYEKDMKDLREQFAKDQRNMLEVLKMDGLLSEAIVAGKNLNESVHSIDMISILTALKESPNDPQLTAKIDNVFRGHNAQSQILAKMLKWKMGRLTQVKEEQTAKISYLQKSLQKLNNKSDEENSSFVSNEFATCHILARGIFGYVFDAVNKFDMFHYAVKRIHVRKRDIDNALREVRAMVRLDHPGIVRYNNAWIEQPPEGWQNDSDLDMFENIGYKIDLSALRAANHDSAFLYIQMQKCNNSLREWLAVNITPRDLIIMKDWFKQIVSAVEYIHGNGLIHRDLKPSNILFTDKDRLKICDLGVVAERQMTDGEECSVECERAGTELYMSPEQVSWSQYSSKSDIFSLGLILAELIVVIPSEKRYEIFDNFRSGKPSDIFPDVETADFIRSLTQRKSEDRPTCKEILKHSFLS